MELILFTKQGCKKCEYVKARIPPGLAVTVLDVETAEGLAELAYRELVGVAEKTLPILVTEDPVIFEGMAICRVTGAIAIRNVLRALSSMRAARGE